MTLTLSNISWKIKNNWVIRDLNLFIEDGECLAILGPSGCGKSSTLRIIAGLEQPNKGQIFIDNQNITNTSPVKRRVGMVFQSYALFPHLTISSNLYLGLKIRGVSPKEQKIRVASILSIMQMEHLSERYPNELSGGQRQRVALARALLREPMVYLLDEPMSNLDAQLREELRPELRRLVIDGEKPVIYVTHDQQEAMAMADRIAVLKKGKLEQIGTPEELYQKPKSIFVASFIGRPQINLLPIKNGIIKAIRPEHIHLDTKGINCKLIHKEWLGINQVLLLETSFGNLRMSCEPNIKVPNKFHINWEKENEHHFDSTTKKRIEKSK